MKQILLFILLIFIFPHLRAQQVADTGWSPAITHPAYDPGKGPVVLIDEGHYNFHTRNGRYLPFARLLEKDGYQVKSLSGQFTMEKLKNGKILVIANALNKINDTSWFLPTPSAFSEEEIMEVRKWVSGGGSLFLIADHMPFGGAAHDLAKAFGFEFTNSFATDTVLHDPALFRISDGTLTDNEITRGKNENEKVTHVATFTGQAFTIPEEAKSILIFNKNFMSYFPDTAWQFNAKTRTEPVKGWSQGAFRKYDKGRVVVFGEAAMFSAQLAGPQKRPVGMNSPVADENYRLLLNIIHWLDGR